MAKRGPKVGHKNTHPVHFDFTEEKYQEAYKLGALGLTVTEIADFWDVPKRTFTRYLQNNDRLRNQVQKGRNEADLTVIQALLQQCKEGNVTAAIFWLKNRQPEKWRDRIPEMTNMPTHVVLNFHANGKTNPEVESRLGKVLNAATSDN